MSHLIDPLHCCIALVPLAAYLFVIGGANLSFRPRVVSGATDTLALWLGLTGFVLMGPMQLFLPSATAFFLGGWVWPLLVSGYLLCLVLNVLLGRPRIVIYNISPEQLRPVLAEVFGALEPEARWAGESAYLPNLGIQLHVEAIGSLRIVQLIATSTAQNFEGWGRLQIELKTRLKDTIGARNPSGVVFVLFGLLLVAACALWAVADADLVAQSFHELIHPGE